jgi:serine/threonine protein kinase
MQLQPLEESPEEKITEKLQSYDEIELISQGAFGCVFRPDIPCEKSLSPNKKYISKIQLNDSNIKNEFNIGEQIQTIPLYYLHFSPILSKCIVSIQQLNQSQIEKCEILKDFDESKSALISTKIKYVGKQNIEHYLHSLPESLSTPNSESQSIVSTNEENRLENISSTLSNTLLPQPPQPQPQQDLPPNIFKTKLLYCFYYVLQSAKMLNEKGIVHFDIKEQNIIYNEYIQAPILIDFGLSFIPTITLPDDIFYTKRVYPYWCIDIYILSYIVNRTIEETIDEDTILSPSEFDLKNERVTEIKIDELLRTYQDEMNAFFQQYMNNLFTEEELQKRIQEYMDSIKAYLLEYVNTSWSNNVYSKLFIPEVYNTWDIYSIAITFLCILNYRVNEENMDEYKSIITILNSIVFSLPMERPTYTKLMEML